MGNSSSNYDAIVYVKVVLDKSAQGYYEYLLEPYPRKARLYYRNPDFARIRSQLEKGSILTLNLEECYHTDGCVDYNIIHNVSKHAQQNIQITVIDVIPAIGLNDYWELLTKERYVNSDKKGASRITIFIEKTSLPDPNSWKGKSLNITLEMFAPPNRFKIINH